MRRTLLVTLLGLAVVATAGVLSHAGTTRSGPLGLPPVPIPEDNPQTPEKIALGDKLFHDKRFSTTGEVSCATCHDPEKAFTDSPLKVSEGINKLTGTRNAPTVVNAAYFNDPVLGRPLSEPRGPGAAPVRQSGGDGAREPRADPRDRAHRPRVPAGASRRSSARAATRSP